MSLDLPTKNFQKRILNKWNLNTHKLRKSQKSDGKHPTIHKAGLADPAPFGLTVYKGRKSWQLPHSFVEFTLHHPVAVAFQGLHRMFKMRV